MKKMGIMFLSLLLVSLSTTSYAVPTLFFNGNVSYNAGNGLLSVDANIVDYADLSSAPVTSGSSLTFATSLLSSTSNALITTADFGASLLSTDLAVFGGDATYLLGGQIASLTMLGVNGGTTGAVFGDVMPTGGSLISDFSASSQLLALELNLSSVFSPSMFLSDFTAQIDGKISSATAVPEPQTLALFGMGLLCLVGFRRFFVSNARTFNHWTE